MLEYIAKTGLFFNSATLYFCVFMVGYLFLDKVIYSRALCLLLFTVIYNVYLKQLFQMPLPAYMHEGFAFPSGHMHSAFVFWGYLATQYRSIMVKAMLGAMIIIGGYGLVYSGYHYPQDILGAWGFGALSIFIYRYLPQQPGFILAMAAALLMCFMDQIKPDMWWALGILITFSTLEHIRVSNHAWRNS